MATSAGLALAALLSVLAPTAAQADGVYDFTPADVMIAPAGRTFTQALTATSPDAVGPLTWALDNQEWPPGLTLGADGVISGTPTGTEENWHPVIRVTDANGLTDTHRYWLRTPNAPTVTTTSLPSGEVGVAYRTQLGFDDGYLYATPNPTWTIEAGALPSGVGLAADGTLSGTPTTAGTASFTVGVTDADGLMGTKDLSITVQSAPAIAPSMAGGTANVQLDTRLVATGGTSPFTWSIVETTYPSWYYLSTSSGYLSGDGAPEGAYTFTARVVDARGATTTQVVSYVVGPPTPPPAPYNVTASQVAGGAYVSWSTFGTGGSPLTGAVITPYRDGLAEDPRPATSTNSATITGLTPGSSYRFAVASTNAIGTGPASTQSRAMTVVDVPLVQAMVTATAETASDGTRQVARITWSPTIDAGHPVTGYEVGYRSSPGGPITSTTIRPSASASTTTVSLPVGVPYWYVVRASNAMGTGPWSAEAGPLVTIALPGAPTAISVVGIADATAPSATISWTPPASTGGGPFIRQEILAIDAADPSGATRTTTQAPGDVTSTTVSGLLSGHTYRFQVRAVNELGAGPWSTPSSLLAFTPPAKPAFQSAQPGNGTARVAWWAPAANGFPITGYVITPSLDGVPQAPQTFGPTTGVTLTGLTNGGTYTFAIAAQSAAGTGEAAVTAPVLVGAPAAPPYPVAVPTASGARVAWQPAVPNGGPILGYRVTPVTGSTVLPTIDFPGSGTRQTITGLTSGSTYVFRVEAYNSYGTSPSAPTAATIVGAPEPPGWQSAVPGYDPSQAVVKWTVPADNGHPIWGYLVEIWRAGVKQRSEQFLPEETTATIGTLEQGVTYQFRVQAWNSVGTSPSVTTNTIVAGTAPAPAFPGAQPGDGTAKVVWTPPTTAIPVTSYLVTPFVGSTALPARTVPAPATSAIVSGLTNGTTYSFKVTAVNQVGAGLQSIATVSVKVGTPTTPVFPNAKPGDRSAIVTAGTPTANAGPITGYVVTPMIGSTARPSQTFMGTGRTWTVTGLANGTTYTFRVVALNAIGAGPFATTAAVKVGIPAAPTAVTASPRTQSAVVSWTAPAANGSPITGYLVTPYIGSKPQPVSAFGATSTTVTITGLTTGTAYTFKVQAVNAIGSSATSGASPAITPT